LLAGPLQLEGMEGGCYASAYREFKGVDLGSVQKGAEPGDESP